MADKVGVKVVVDGESEFRASIKNINNEMKTLTSEMKLVDSEFRGQANTMAALTTKHNILQKEYDEQKAKVEALNKAYQKANEVYGENGAKTEEYKQKLNYAKVALNNLDDELKKNNKYLDEAKKSTDGCATSINNYGNETKAAAEKSGLLSKIFAGGFLANVATQALTAVISKIKELASQAFNTADTIATMSEKTGFSTSQLQEMQYVGTKLDVELDTMVTGFTRLTKGMNSAMAGSGSAYDAFKKLHVEYEDGNGKLRDANVVYGEVIDALGRMTNETERDATAMILMGKSATDLNPIIKAGSDELSDLTEQAHSAGAVMSDETVAALDYAKDSFDAAKLSATAFVGEALAGIIGDGKTAAETMSDLSEKLADQKNIETLIEKYKNLTAEVSDSSTNTAQLSIKSAELEQAKQDLIKASGGLVTAFDIENGTFAQQVKVLENATQAEKEYLKNKLIGQILENSGDAATKKATKAAEDCAQAEESLAWAIENRNKIREKVDAHMASNEALERAQEDVDGFYRAVVNAQTAAVEASESSAVAENALKSLVDNGLMSAAEATEMFSNYGIDVSSILNETGAAAADTIPEIQSMAEQIDALNAEYQAAYDSALQSLQGQYDLWSNAPTIVATSVQQMQAALDSNTEYFTNYKANIEMLMAVTIPGIDMQPLIDSISDGTPEAAARAQGLADAIRSGNTDAVTALAESAAAAQASEKALATELGKVATDYDKKYADIVNSIAENVQKMDKSEEAKQAGIDTLQGYITGVNNQSGPLNIAMSNAAQAAMTAWKNKLGIASPSKVFKEYGKNTIEGAIIGVDSMQETLAETYSKMGDNLMTGLSTGMKNSSGKVMSTADEVGKELSTRLSDILSVFSMSSDVSELKYSLWEMTSGKGATSQEKSEKKLESLNEQAEIEKQQIESLETALSKMTELYGANSEESLKLQKQLLQEQIAYEKLKKSIQEVSEAKTSVDTDKLATMADQEYKLWYTENPNASDSEKLAKQAEVLNLKLDMQGEAVSETESELAEMVKQYGANSDESIKLQEQLLKEKIAYAELKEKIDEVNKAMSQYGITGTTSSGFLQVANMWNSLNGSNINTDMSAVNSAKKTDISGVVASAVNAVGTVVGQKAKGDLIIEVPVNGKPFCRAIIKDFRDVDSATPKVVSDKL